MYDLMKKSERFPTLNSILKCNNLETRAILRVESMKYCCSIHFGVALIRSNSVFALQRI